MKNDPTSKLVAWIQSVNAFIAAISKQGLTTGEADCKALIAQAMSFEQALIAQAMTFEQGPAPRPTVEELEKILAAEKPPAIVTTQ